MPRISRRRHGFGRGGGRNSDDVGHGQRRGGIFPVMLSRHGKLWHGRIIFRVVYDLNLYILHHFRNGRIVRIAHNNAVRLACRLHGECVKCVLNIGKILVIIQMVGLDVRDDEHLRIYIQKRSLVFAGLDNKIFTLAHDQIRSVFFQ